MAQSKRNRVSKTARDRIAQLKQQLCEFDLVCTGTLAKRTKVCGKAGCRCAQDPQARHGPYYEWGCMREGKQVRRMVSPEQAKLLRKAIANYRTIRRLLRDWEAQTLRLMETEKRSR